METGAPNGTRGAEGVCDEAECRLGLPIAGVQERTVPRNNRDGRSLARPRKLESSRRARGRGADRRHPAPNVAVVVASGLVRICVHGQQCCHARASADGKRAQFGQNSSRAACDAGSTQRKRCSGEGRNVAVERAAITDVSVATACPVIWPKTLAT